MQLGAHVWNNETLKWLKKHMCDALLLNEIGRDLPLMINVVSCLRKNIKKQIQKNDHDLTLRQKSAPVRNKINKNLKMYARSANKKKIILQRCNI